MKIRVFRTITTAAISLCFLLTAIAGHAQDTLRLTTAEAESRFLQENLMLLAERLNIPRAEAALLQAKLWPNPEFEIDEVNFKSGSRRQYALSVEQLILTAGKRKKLMALEQVTIDKSKEYFQEILRNLKFEFRATVLSLQHLQLIKEIYQNELLSVTRLTRAYKNQVEQGNIPRNEYIRLKALQLEILKDINDADQEINVAEKELKTLLNIPYQQYVRISSDSYFLTKNDYGELKLQDLIEQAKRARPDYRIAQLDKRLYNRLFDFEKAQRAPNIRLKAGYDRAGGIYDHFFGIGAAIDLPIFNRNQGNIRQAQIAGQQADIHASIVEKSIENEITLAYQNLRNALAFLQHVEPGYEDALDQMLQAYTRNFLNRNISMLDYLDFLEAYISNKKLLLENLKNIHERAEELNYTTGVDLLNNTL